MLTTAHNILRIRVALKKSHRDWKEVLDALEILGEEDDAPYNDFEPSKEEILLVREEVDNVQQKNHLIKALGSDWDKTSEVGDMKHYRIKIDDLVKATKKVESMRGASSDVYELQSVALVIIELRKNLRKVLTLEEKEDSAGGGGNEPETDDITETRNGLWRLVKKNLGDLDEAGKATSEATSSESEGEVEGTGGLKVSVENEGLKAAGNEIKKVRREVQLHDCCNKIVDMLKEGRKLHSLGMVEEKGVSILEVPINR